MAKIQWDDDSPSITHIKVIGVGGGGCNAVDDMVNKGFQGVEFYAVNTDFLSLKRCRVPNKIQIGEEITHGLGAGANPEMGEQAARAAEKQIRAILEGADMVFITAGMGGGTGTGAGPVIAKFAREMGILSVAIVTKPFTFEGPQRMRRANEGIKRLRENVDTMIIIMNDKLMETVGPKTPVTEAFAVGNGVLAQGIRAISDLISMPGLINVDFRDVRTIMGETGGAVMGVGIGKGENRSSEAVKKACHSPLQEKIVIDGAKGVLINITGGPDITMHEINEATSIIYETADPDANIIFGVVIDEKMNEEMRVTIIATGFHDNGEQNASVLGGLDALRGSVRSRPAAPTFANTTPAPSVTPAIQPEEPQGIKEPDPIPALHRKQAQKLATPTPSIDFERDDNPLREWDKEMPATAPLETPKEEDRFSASSFHSAQTPVEEQPEGATDDPYDIPALHRRRKQRFFE